MKRKTTGKHEKENTENYLKIFLKIFPGDNLLSMFDGLVGVWGDWDCCWSSSDFSGILSATSVAELLRDAALAFAFASANVSDGELYRRAIKSIIFWLAVTNAPTADSCFGVGFSELLN